PPAPNPPAAGRVGRVLSHRLRGSDLARSRRPRHPLSADFVPRTRRLRPAPDRRAAGQRPEVRRPAHTALVPKKLVLAVIDSLKPELLDRAIAEGRAPALAAVVERGTYVKDCVSSYPS